MTALTEVDETEPRGLYDRVSGGRYLSCSPKKFDTLVRDGHIATIIPFGFKRGRMATKAELDRYIAASVAAAQPVPDLIAVPSLSAVQEATG